MGVYDALFWVGGDEWGVGALLDNSPFRFKKYNLDDALTGPC